jgi:hypothetical protein
MQSGVFPNAKSRGKSFPREIDCIEVAESMWNERIVASQRANGIYGICGNDKAFLYDSRPFHSSLFPLSFIFWNGPESGVTQATEHLVYSSLLCSISL